MEARGIDTGTQAGEDKPKVPSVSAVADIDVRDRDEADRISSMLLAVMNTQDPLMSRSSLNVRQYEGGHQLRVMLWGHPRFVIQMLECIEALSVRID